MSNARAGPSKLHTVGLKDIVTECTPASRHGVHKQNCLLAASADWPRPIAATESESETETI
jgi:hypothetical protein